MSQNTDAVAYTGGSSRAVAAASWSLSTPTHQSITAAAAADTAERQA